MEEKRGKGQLPWLVQRSKEAIVTPFQMKH